MATVRELRNKIRSVKNTKKITRTMEMISTAKARVCQKRIEAVKPYGDKLAELLRDLKSGGGASEAGMFPLLRVAEPVVKELLFVVTANRGLCGGYNANVLRAAEKYLDLRAAAGAKMEVHMIGRKGISRFRYLKREVAQKYIQFNDKPSFAEAEEVLAPQLKRYIAGELDGITIISTRYEHATKQYPQERKLLPIADEPAPAAAGSSGSGGGGAGAAVAAKGAQASFAFEPSPEVILESLLPLSLKTQFFQALVAAAACEQIARRIAMKNATDNADEMTGYYTQVYNRTRQSKITQEILEVIGGAEGL